MRKRPGRLFYFAVFRRPDESLFAVRWTRKKHLANMAPGAQFIGSTTGHSLTEVTAALEEEGFQR